MKRNNKLCGCIDVTNDGVIRQAFGPCNKEFKDKDLEIFEAWESSCGFSKLTDNFCATPASTSMPKKLAERIWDTVVEEYGLAA